MNDIPLSRVQEAVKTLLDLPTLDGVISVHIDEGAVTAEVYARDDEGKYFLRGDEIAVNVLRRRVVGS